MEFFSAEFFTSLLLIIGIDLVLAGDNAIVIALAAAKLEKKQQKKAIIFGTVGAIAIRTVATLIVVWLLKVPGLHLIGGLLLVWIAFNLLRDHGKDKKIAAKSSLGAAVGTIIVADALMGLDNVLAIGGAASGHYLLVILGLLISIPLVMGGSALFLGLVERFRWVTDLGAAILAFTAGKMIFTESFMHEAIAGFGWAKWLIILLIIAGVLYFGRMGQQRSRSKKRMKAEDSKIV
ncbi:MAG: TerC family protein [Sporolactobacillus sp.]